MKLELLLTAVLVFSGCGGASKHFILEVETEVEVVELKDLRFDADSFFDERKNISFREGRAAQVYSDWAIEAVRRVNRILPTDAHLPDVKIKLIFRADIADYSGKRRTTPISIIESYQEPKTNSIRLGMLELAQDKESFQLTVAHEYAHLVFENASRKAGVTSPEEDHLSFWPKSLYEGVADLMMAMAMDSNRTAGPQNWSSKSLSQFKALADARKAKDDTVNRARRAFRQMGLFSSFPVYQDWLVRVKGFIESLGGVDPYAEGRWLAGSLRERARTDELRRKVAASILVHARQGKKVDDIQAFHDEIARQL